MKGKSSSSESQYTRCVIQDHACVRRHSLSVTVTVSDTNTAVPAPARSCASPLGPGSVRLYQGRKYTGSECHVPATIHARKRLQRSAAQQR